MLSTERQEEQIHPLVDCMQTSAKEVKSLTQTGTDEVLSDEVNTVLPLMQEAIRDGEQIQ